MSDSGNWRTLLLVLVTHLLIVLIALAPISTAENWFAAHPVFAVILLAPVLTMYSSLSHEVIHGHPFHNQFLNDLLVLVPYGILVPYYRFKDTHLAHHRDAMLCDPYDDPESWYQFRTDWEKRKGLSRAVFNFNNTLGGRMLIGPLVGLVGFVKSDIGEAMSGQRHILGKWGLHIVMVVGLFIANSAYGYLPAWVLWLSAYIGMSLLMVRTFLEHQAHEKSRGRSVIVENGGAFGFLFLNNSLHAVHHAHPNLAWYRLPKLFQENRKRYLSMNEGYAFSDYGAIFRKYFFQAKEPVSLEEALAQRSLSAIAARGKDE